MDEVERLAVENQPKMIVAGWSAYPRQLDFKRFRETADKVGALPVRGYGSLCRSGSSAGLHPSPVPYAHVVTSTTHKTLAGPRGGIILSNDADIAKKINSAVFLCQQGGPLEHVIAGKAVAFKIAASEEFKERQQRTLAGSRILAERLTQEDVAAKGITAGPVAPMCIWCSLTFVTRSLTDSRQKIFWHRRRSRLTATRFHLIHVRQ